MLWLFNPPCPDASPTHPMFGGTAPARGIGIAQSAPPFMFIRTGPATSNLPDYPEAIGEFRLQALAAPSIAMWDGYPLSPTNDRPWAEWSTDPYGLSGNFNWHVGYRGYESPLSQGVANVPSAWYCWYGPFLGLEPGNPPIYFGSDDSGGFDPLIGGRFERAGIYGNYTPPDGQSLYVDVWPFWP